MTVGCLEAVQNMTRLSDNEKVFVTYQTGLAKKFLKTMGLNPSTHGDLFQAAMVGIMMAKKNHDPSRGAFSTYAFYCMRTCVLKELEFSKRTVDIKKEAIDRARERWKARRTRLKSFKGFVKTKRFRLNPFEDAVRIQLRKVDSLDGVRFLGRDRDGNRTASLHDVLEDPLAVNPEDFILKREIENEVKRIFDSTGIEFRERAIKFSRTRRVPSYYADKIIRERFWEDMTLERCGIKLECTRERIRQIEVKFLRLFKYRFKRQIRSNGEIDIQEYNRLFGSGIEEERD